MSTFELENRYIVIKANKLTAGQSRALNEFIDSHGIVELEAGVVIESDWPEYVPTVAALEARISGVNSPVEAYPTFEVGGIDLFPVGARVRFLGRQGSSEYGPDIGAIGIVLERDLCPWVSFEGYDGMVVLSLGHRATDAFCAHTRELEAV